MVNVEIIYDWIVIGAGITGASLAYELSQQGYQVLLFEKNLEPDNATVYSYGGLAYWSGTDALTRTLGQEGLELHRHLAAELEAETEFRELDLVLTIDRQDNPETIASNFNHFAVTPELLNVQEACVLEPLLNPNAISGVLKLPHGQINPQKTAQAYIQAFERNGGKVIYEEAEALLWQHQNVIGIKTPNKSYYADQTAICAGGLSRSLLQRSNIELHNYFTHAQLIMTPPVELELGTVVMPAVQRRFRLESETMDFTIENNSFDNPELSILDAGAVQFLDGRLCLGQISAIAPDPKFKFDLSAAEAQIRHEVGTILPLLEDIPGRCHSCLVAFNNQGIALVGEVKNCQGLYIFSGFTSTLVYAPILARRFARWTKGNQDQVIEQLQLVLNKSLKIC
ncbi:MAG: FAD-binding oxidoreductase [Cyanobacteria bacterium P01_G01_bin.67]